MRTQDCSLNSFYIKYCAFYNKNGNSRLPQTCLCVALFANVFLSDVCATANKRICVESRGPHGNVSVWSQEIGTWTEDKKE